MELIPLLPLLLVVVGLVSVAYCPPPLLPPPDDPLDPEEGDPDDDLRGLKGISDPLSFLSKTSTKCTTEGNYAIKNECSKYMSCSRKGGFPSTRYCPSGKFFDHFKRVCVRTSDAECKNTCPADVSVLEDPTTDYGYLRCVKGVPLGYKCPSHGKFIPEKKICHGGSWDKHDKAA